MNEKEAILKSLEPMFKRAEKEGLWFHSAYQDMWVSPKELRDYQKDNRFIWGIDNWELRDPEEKINVLLKNIESFKDAIYEIRKRML